MRFESRRDRSPNEVPRALVKRWPWAQWLQWHQWLHRHRHRCHIDVMDVAFLWPCFHTYFPFASYLFHRHLLLDTKLFRIQVSMVFNLASMVSPIPWKDYTTTYLFDPVWPRYECIHAVPDLRDRAEKWQNIFRKVQQIEFSESPWWVTVGNRR